MGSNPRTVFNCTVKSDLISISRPFSFHKNFLLNVAIVFFIYLFIYCKTHDPEPSGGDQQNLVCTCVRFHREVRLSLQDAVDEPSAVSVRRIVCVCSRDLNHRRTCRGSEPNAIITSSQQYLQQITPTQNAAEISFNKSTWSWKHTRLQVLSGFSNART